MVICNFLLIIAYHYIKNKLKNCVVFWEICPDHVTEDVTPYQVQEAVKEIPIKVKLPHNMFLPDKGEKKLQVIGPHKNG